MARSRAARTGRTARTKKRAAAKTATGPNQDQASLLTLPREVRLQIYDNLIPHEPSMQSTSLGEHDVQNTRPPALIHVNKQLRIEYLIAYAHQMLFHISLYFAWDRRLHLPVMNWGYWGLPLKAASKNVMPVPEWIESNQEHIRFRRLQFDLKDDCQLAATPEFGWGSKVTIVYKARSKTFEIESSAGLIKVDDEQDEMIKIRMEKATRSIQEAVATLVVIGTEGIADGITLEQIKGLVTVLNASQGDGHFVFRRG